MKWWDKSWNPVSGCTECSEGCENCVALNNLLKQGGGSADAMNMLALCYRKGIGTSPNPDKSEFWKKHAARSGRKFSLVHLTE